MLQENVCYICLLSLSGLTCLLLYYRFCHSSGPIKCCQTALLSDSQKENECSSVRGIAPLPTANICSTPHLSSRISAGSRFNIQASLVSKQPSSLTLSRRSLLKSHSHLNPARSASLVQFKEVATPSQLSPIKCSDQSFNPKSPVYADTTDIRLDDSSAFQHYSVDATACLYSSQCNTLSATGVDLSRAATLDSEDTKPTPIKESLLVSAGSDDITSLPDASEHDSGTSEGMMSTDNRSSPPEQHTGTVHCRSCGYAPRGLNFYPQCCQSPAYKEAASLLKAQTQDPEQSDEDDSMSLSSHAEEFYSNFQNLSHLVQAPEGTPVRETSFV